MADINIEAYVQKVVDYVKKAPEKLKEITASNETLKKFLGDDGKLSKDDLDRVMTAVKASAAVKAVLGEDGKLDKEDLARLGNEARELGENLFGKAKNLFGK
ncbi:MAG: hypothetical protein IKD69_15445 [Solobacterium sp.]|nr:hypothetical protein [Solobacterium sp.]